jgi:hypothetical protein
MVKHIPKPWSNIVKQHGRHSPKTWSTIVKNMVNHSQKHGQQSSTTLSAIVKHMVEHRQTTWSTIVTKHRPKTSSGAAATLLVCYSAAAASE